jgi:hypothetical protein
MPTRSLKIEASVVRDLSRLAVFGVYGDTAETVGVVDEGPRRVRAQVQVIRGHVPGSDELHLDGASTVGGVGEQDSTRTSGRDAVVQQGVEHPREVVVVAGPERDQRIEDFSCHQVSELRGDLIAVLGRGLR